MLTTLNRLSACRNGATAIEYGLIAAFVALSIVATLPSIKRNLAQVFGSVDRELSQASRATRGR